MLCSPVTTNLFFVRLARHHRRDADGRPGKYGAAFASQNPVPQPNAMPKILPKFSDFPSHRIFEHMHKALNIDKK
jgi:hypothetical protein